MHVINGGIELVVVVSIRKGLGPECVDKSFSVAFDDLENDTTEWEIKEMAKREVEGRLRKSIDYPYYGENWIIKEYYQS